MYIYMFRRKVFDDEATMVHSIRRPNVKKQVLERTRRPCCKRCVAYVKMRTGPYLPNCAVCTWGVLMVIPFPLPVACAWLKIWWSHSTEPPPSLNDGDGVPVLAPFADLLTLRPRTANAVK